MTSDPDSSSAAAPRPLDEDALVSVLVAAYDEEATIARVLEQVSALGLNAELIVVDDGSSDRTPEILRRLEQTGEIPACAHHPPGQSGQGRRHPDRDRRLAWRRGRHPRRRRRVSRR